MTPCINIARKAGIVYKLHEYEHDSSFESYGSEAAVKLGADEQCIFKTLIVCLSTSEMMVAVIPVSSMLDLKLMARAAGAKKAGMAEKLDVERSTGYFLGGVSPLGQKKRLRTIVDCSAIQRSTIFVSAGRRGLEIELKPEDLVKLAKAKIADICQ
jgi:Cys-tRNA(Pro)/Cys-tRNA(Cys) deacylase